MTTPNKPIELVTRTCLSCGTLEHNPATGRVAHYRPEMLPRSTGCDNCGTRSLVPDEIMIFKPRESVELDWETDKPRIGRPPKALVQARLALAKAKELEAERAAS